MLIRRAKYRVARVIRRRSAAARSPRKLFHLEHATWVTGATLPLWPDHTSPATTGQGRIAFIAQNFVKNVKWVQFVTARRIGNYSNF